MLILNIPCYLYFRLSVCYNPRDTLFFNEIRKKFSLFHSCLFLLYVYLQKMYDFLNTQKPKIGEGRHNIGNNVVQNFPTEDSTGDLIMKGKSD